MLMLTPRHLSPPPPQYPTADLDYSQFYDYSEGATDTIATDEYSGPQVNETIPSSHDFIPSKDELQQQDGVLTLRVRVNIPCACQSSLCLFYDSAFQYHLPCVVLFFVVWFLHPFGIKATSAVSF